MNQRSPRKSSPPSGTNGGNVIFTLGLVSVVALLIVGWVMTQGGVSQLTNDGLKNMTSINITPTTPTAIPKPTIAAIPQANVNQQGPSVDEVISLYERKLQEQKVETQKQMQSIRQRYENQITNLKTQLQLLEAENKSLRESE